ncbi:MAG: hypothetical protein IMZ54_07815 [Acidobacteria bacterium]|nr:hypothetical protein [Acidobacteriota bacterium]
MPIILFYLNGRQRIVQGESWTQLNNAGGQALGCVTLRRLSDGGKIIVIKSALADVEEFSEETWKKMKDEEEAAAADAAKKRSDDEADKKSKAAAETLRLLESKTVRGRIRKLFGRKG